MKSTARRTCLRKVKVRIRQTSQLECKAQEGRETAAGPPELARGRTLELAYQSRELYLGPSNSKACLTNKEWEIDQSSAG